MDALDEAVKKAEEKVEEQKSIFWAPGKMDRGHGHGSFAVMTIDGDVLAGNVDPDLVDYIVDLHNDRIKLNMAGPKTSSNMMSEGGIHLRAARHYLLWNITRGSALKWGSGEQTVTLTVRQVEEMACKIAAALHNDRLDP